MVTIYMYCTELEMTHVDLFNRPTNVVVVVVVVVRVRDM